MLIVRGMRRLSKCMYRHMNNTIKLMYIYANVDGLARRVSAVVGYMTMAQRRKLIDDFGFSVKSDDEMTRLWKYFLSERKENVGNNRRV